MFQILRILDFLLWSIICLHRHKNLFRVSSSYSNWKAPSRFYCRMSAIQSTLDSESLVIKINMTFRLSTNRIPTYVTENDNFRKPRWSEGDDLLSSVHSSHSTHQQFRLYTYLRTMPRWCSGNEGELHAFLTLVLDWSEWSGSQAGCPQVGGQVGEAEKSNTLTSTAFYNVGKI